jgi:hypothetical protein
MLGAFIGYADLPDGSGLQARIAAAYQHGSADFIRANLIGSAKNVSADAGINTYGVAGQIGWGYKVMGDTLLTPYIGLAATKSERDSFSESGKSGAVEDPFSYDSFGVSQVTGILGVRMDGMVSQDVGYHLGVGLEHDFSYDVDNFTVKGDFGSDSYKSNYAPYDWRVTGAAGVYYMIDANKQILLDGYVSQFDEDATDYAVTVGFKFGL